MEDFINSLSQRLDLPVENVRSATRVFFSFIKDRVGEERFAEIVEVFPGITDVMSQPDDDEASEEPSARGGLVGTLFGQASGMLGGAAQALAGLQQSGIPLDKAAPFAQAFVDEAERVVGKEAVDEMLDSIPEVKALLGREV